MKQKIFSKRCKSTKNGLTVDVARGRSKTLKKEEGKQKMRKSQTTASLLLLFYIGKLIFCKKTYLQKLSLLLHLHFRFFT